MAAMETLSEAISRLTDAGYVHDLRAHRRQLLCDRCGAFVDPSEMDIDEIVRVEGMSDPDDQAICTRSPPRAGRSGSTRPRAVPTRQPTTSQSPERCRAVEKPSFDLATCH